MTMFGIPSHLSLASFLWGLRPGLGQNSGHLQKPIPSCAYVSLVLAVPAELRERNSKHPLRRDSAEIPPLREANHFVGSHLIAVAGSYGVNIFLAAGQIASAC